MTGSPQAEPFFLRAGAGERFCLYHAPAAPCRGALLYVHPFGDEMNRTRRMAALQARMLAARGFGVLQVDLYGCGDSSGDFGAARWDLWKDDLALAHAWLAERLGQPVGLWGLRLGALLALDYADGATAPLSRLILWQPVASGATFLTQFLRLRMAGDLVNGAGGGADTPQALRAQLLGGVAVEIGGYLLAPELAAGLEGADAARCTPRVPVDWFDIVAAADRPATPAALRVVQGWRAAGSEVALHTVPGPAFWATQEITECPALLDATTAALEVPQHA